MACFCEDVGALPCGRGRGDCRNNLCLLCEKRHSKCSRCKVDCGCNGSEKCNDHLRCKNMKCQLCNGTHKVGGKCHSLESVAPILNNITDACLEKTRLCERLDPVEDGVKKVCINAFIKNTYNEDNLLMHVCGVCGKCFTKKQLKMVELRNDDFASVCKYDAAREFGRLPCTRTLYQHSDGMRYIIWAGSVDSETERVAVCSSCRSYISKGAIPPHSFVKIDPGPRDNTLPYLSLAESLCLCTHRVSVLVYRCAYGMSAKSARQRYLKGHALAFSRRDNAWLFDEMYDGKPLIAHGIDSLAESLRVVCLSYVQSLEEARELIRSAKDLRVNVNVLKKWFKHLGKYHAQGSFEFKDSFMISKVNNRNHTSGVPDVLLMQVKANSINFYNPSLDVEADALHEGYDHEDFMFEQADTSVSSDGQMEGRLFFVVPEDPGDIAEKTDINGLVWTNVNDIVSEKSSGYFYLSFVDLFYYRYGCPEVVNGKWTMDVNEWANLLLSRVDRRFVKHYSFMFLVFSIKMRHEVFVQSRCKMRKSDIRFIGDLNANEKELLVRLLSREIKFCNTTPDSVKRAYRKVISAGAPVPKSEKSMNVKRHVYENGFIPLFGAPNMFLTLNFNTEKHILFVKIAGLSSVKIKVKTDKGRKYVKHTTTAYERNVEASSDPVTCAVLFDYLVKMTLKFLLSCPDNVDDVLVCGYDQRRHGVLGKVQSYVGETETNKRKTLHVHFLLKVWNLDSRFTSLHAKDTFVKYRLRKFVDSVANAGLVEGYEFCDKSAEVFERQIGKEERKRAKAKDSFSSRADVEYPIRELRDELQMMIPCEITTRLKDNKGYKVALSVLKRKCEYHMCTYTCFPQIPTSKKRKKRCRLNNVKCKVRKNVFIDSDTGKIFVRRDVSRLVCSNDAMLYCIGCNMHISLLNASKAASGHYYTFQYNVKLNPNVAVDLAYLKQSMEKKIAYGDEGTDESVAKEVQGLMNSLVGML